MTTNTRHSTSTARIAMKEFYSTIGMMSEQETIDADHHLELADAARIVLVAIACILVWFRVWEPFARISLIGLAAALVGMFPILEEAFEAILKRRMTME